MKQNSWTSFYNVFSDKKVKKEWGGGNKNSKTWNFRKNKSLFHFEPCKIETAKQNCLSIFQPFLLRPRVQVTRWHLHRKWAGINQHFHTGSPTFVHRMGQKKVLATHYRYWKIFHKCYKVKVITCRKKVPRFKVSSQMFMKYSGSCIFDGDNNSLWSENPW